MRTSQDLILDHYHKELRNTKNNIFLTKLVSSTPKFSEDQIKPQIAPLIKSQKIEGNWHFLASEHSCMTPRERAVNKWSRLIVAQGKVICFYFLSILSLLFLDLRLCIRALFCVWAEKTVNQGILLHPGNSFCVPQGLHCTQNLMHGAPFCSLASPKSEQEMKEIGAFKVFLVCCKCLWFGRARRALPEAMYPWLNLQL